MCVCVFVCELDAAFDEVSKCIGGILVTLGANPERFSLNGSTYSTSSLEEQCVCDGNAGEPAKLSEETPVGRRKCGQRKVLPIHIKGFPTPHTFLRFHQPPFFHSSPHSRSHKMGGRSPITCHVLDSSCGKPGRNVPVKLEQLNPAANNAWTSVAYG